MNCLLSIAICTFNRKEILPYCLDAIHPQISSEVELLVIDNGTESVENICNNYAHIKYYKENNTGLSYARNKAIKVAKGEYILYLDDDAKASPNFVNIALKACNKGYAIFGGVYLPWYFYGKPKWFKDEYASNKMKYTQDTALTKGEYLSGGIMAFNRSIFNTIGIFKTDIGMIGKTVGYGEESELQDRARLANIQITYIPELQMDHLVAEYKLHVPWFLNAYKARGADMAKYHRGNIAITILKESFILAMLGAFDAFRYGIKWISQKNYYQENWQIDALKKVYKRIGYIYHLLYARR